MAGGDRAGDAERLLAIYLNDHLAGSTAGVELARRSRAANAGDPRFAGPLGEHCAEAERDRDSLVAIMRRLGVRPGVVKPAGAWALEKLGRLKLNGRCRGYSPLSRVIEIEVLYVGVCGKLRLWRALESELGGRFPELDLAGLAERAEGQRERLAELHLIAAAEAMPGSASFA